MRNFVTSLVRRGAGLPMPAMIRPAGFKMPLSPVAGEANPGVTTTEPITHSERVAVSPVEISAYPRPHAAIEPESAGIRPEQRLFLTEMPQKSAPEEGNDFSITLAPAPASQSVTSRAQDSDEVSSDSRNPEATAKFPPAPQVTPAPQVSPLWVVAPSRPSQAADKSNDAVKKSNQELRVGNEPPTESLRIQIVPRQEPVTVPRAAARASGSAPKAEGKAPEQRSIQVKIGRVEIRSTQSAPPVRAARRQPAAGFADLTLARTHLDRSGW